MPKLAPDATANLESKKGESTLGIREAASLREAARDFETRAIETAAAVDCIAAAPAVEHFSGAGRIAAAGQCVAEVRAAHLAYATHDGIDADAATTGRSGRQIDGDGTVGIDVRNARLAVAGDGIVAAKSLELIEAGATANIQAGPGKAGRVIGIGEIRTVH